jgi:tRNA (cytidine56-2'-O)-methyltransferase
MIEVLRLGHRIARDKRISTHVGLVSRAFGASKLYYSGQKDGSLEGSILKVVEDFGGDFEVEHIKGVSSFIKKKKKEGFRVAHLTVYGEVLSDVGLKGDLLIIVGGEKVPAEIYELADYNISVGLQPHSEVAALGIVLYNFFGEGILEKDFNGKMKVVPQKKGKKVEQKD